MKKKRQIEKNEIVKNKNERQIEIDNNWNKKRERSRQLRINLKTSEKLNVK